MFIAPFVSLFVVPHYPPFSWKKIVWIYVFPLYPLTALWEGITSNLRTYTPKELRQIIKNIDRADFHWETGKPGSAIYLIGYALESGSKGNA